MIDRLIPSDSTKNDILFLIRMRVLECLQGLHISSYATRRNPSGIGRQRNWANAFDGSVLWTRRVVLSSRASRSNTPLSSLLVRCVNCYTLYRYVTQHTIQTTIDSFFYFYYIYSFDFFSKIFIFLLFYCWQKLSSVISQ